MEEAKELEAPTFEPDALDAKVQDSFAGMAARKDLTAKMSLTIAIEAIEPHAPHQDFLK